MSVSIDVDLNVSKNLQLMLIAYSYVGAIRFVFIDMYARIFALYNIFIYSSLLFIYNKLLND